MFDVDGNFIKVSNFDSYITCLSDKSLEKTIYWKFLHLMAIQKFFNTVAIGKASVQGQSFSVCAAIFYACVRYEFLTSQDESA